MNEKQSKQIRLIAVDLDGTLFNSKHVPPLRSVEALKDTLQAGIQVILATGRKRPYVINLLNEIDLDLPFICSGGSAIISGRDDKVISARPFQLDSNIAEIVGLAMADNSIMIGDYLDGGMIWYATDEMIKAHQKYLLDEMDLRERCLLPEKEFVAPMVKFSMIQLDGKISNVAELNQRFPAYHFVYSGYNCIDMTERTVDKGSALKIYAELKGFAPHEIAAIGDQRNDLPMLQYAGVSIAMGNAPEEVQKQTDWVAPTNDEDGAAWALHKFIGLNSAA